MKRAPHGERDGEGFAMSRGTLAAVIAIVAIWGPTTLGRFRHD